MIIEFLGTGTSQGVPVIACNCRVCTSDDARNRRLRSSILIHVQGKTLVIDTGPDFRYQMLRAEVKHLDAVLYTHAHKDHIAGLDDVRAFNYFQGTAIDVYGDHLVQDALKREFYYIFAPHKYPGIPQINLKDVGNQLIAIGDAQVQPIDVMHYKLPIKGYRFGDFTYLTDVKTLPDASLEKVRGTKVLVLNALQKEPHISHLTLDEAIALAKQINADQTYFTHISHRLGLHQEVLTELPSNMSLAYDGLVLEV
ncbi:MBL fold metallo-hydrolase [Olivibacter sp. SDN3]|uniref:MBL fold metallo-hydrolase n=1 Tax=Olivibacter sp. SDN3 TaxID=2764720 RepID=UPI001650D7C0|nr:MBL fold metallo-hydrolase [Olivibacter sp. SDN3]QNL48339.1 MBL fold metallo-hydrolase [Olivibacter sp. SDN3]